MNQVQPECPSRQIFENPDCTWAFHKHNLYGAPKEEDSSQPLLLQDITLEGAFFLSLIQCPKSLACVSANSAMSQYLTFKSHYF